MKYRYRSLLSLLAFAWPYRLVMLGGFAALCVTSASVLSIGVGIRFLIDQGFSSGNEQTLNQALGLLIGMATLLALATWARFYLVMKVGELVVADIRRALFMKILSLPPGYFEIRQSGAILSRITTDTTLIQTMAGSSFSMALRNLLILIGGIAMIIFTSPKLALYMAIVVPLTVLPIILLGKRVRALARAAQDRVAEAAAHAQEVVGGIRTVQAAQAEPAELTRFTQRLDNTLRAALARLWLRGILTAVVIFLAFGSVGFVLWMGGHMVLTGALSAGALSSFIFYAIMIAGSVGALSEVAGDFQRAAGAADGILELLNAESHITDPAAPVAFLAPFRGEIRFEQVAFSYPTRTKQRAVEEIDLTIRPGEKVALVGASGSGKTTLFQLLMRFYDPTSGRVLLDGIDIRSVALTDLRSRFGMVPQDPVIFSGTAYENIAYGLEGVTEEQVLQAAHMARAGFILNLPEGFNTQLGERGVRLSGGERQRIAIARAILRNPPILLLDEATNALDAENEKLVQEALETLMQGRTTLMIAHRLATVLSADRIVMMDKGRIEAVGTHQQLVAQGSLYARLAELQFGN